MRSLVERARDTQVTDERTYLHLPGRHIVYVSYDRHISLQNSYHQPNEHQPAVTGFWLLCI